MVVGGVGGVVFGGVLVGGVCFGGVFFFFFFASVWIGGGME